MQTSNAPLVKGFSKMLRSKHCWKHTKQQVQSVESVTHDLSQSQYFRNAKKNSKSYKLFHYIRISSCAQNKLSENRTKLRAIKMYSKSQESWPLLLQTAWKRPSNNDTSAPLHGFGRSSSLNGGLLARGKPYSINDNAPPPNFHHWKQIY